MMTSVTGCRAALPLDILARVRCARRRRALSAVPPSPLRNVDEVNGALVISGGADIAFLSP